MAKARAMATDLLATDPKLAEMVRRLVAHCHPERIYLFGSRPRGTADEDSDYDLLVVTAASDQPAHRRAQDAFRALCGVGASKDVVVLTREEFEGRLSVTTSLPAIVAREGVLLYAA
jgi:predicted nucleotidyltransferase